MMINQTLTNYIGIDMSFLKQERKRQAFKVYKLEPLPPKEKKVKELKGYSAPFNKILTDDDRLAIALEKEERRSGNLAELAAKKAIRLKAKLERRLERKRIEDEVGTTRQHQKRTDKERKQHKIYDISRKQLLREEQGSKRVKNKQPKRIRKARKAKAHQKTQQRKTA